MKGEKEGQVMRTLDPTLYTEMLVPGYMGVGREGPDPCQPPALRDAHRGPRGRGGGHPSDPSKYGARSTLNIIKENLSRKLVKGLTKFNFSTELRSG